MSWLESNQGTWNNPEDIRIRSDNCYSVLCTLYSSPYELSINHYLKKKKKQYKLVDSGMKDTESGVESRLLHSSLD